MSTHTAPTLDWVSVPSHIAEGPAQVRHKDGWLVCEVPSDEYARIIAAAPKVLADVAKLREALILWVDAAEALADRPGMEAHFHDVADTTFDVVLAARGGKP